jgi:hypothetical protein
MFFDLDGALALAQKLLNWIGPDLSVILGLALAVVVVNVAINIFNNNSGSSGGTSA